MSYPEVRSARCRSGTVLTRRSVTPVSMPAALVSCRSVAQPANGAVALIERPHRRDGAMGTERAMQVREALIAARRVDAIGQLEHPKCCRARAVDLAGMKMALGEPARVERRLAGASVPVALQDR